MFAKIAGRTMEEMTHIDWMSITHPDDIQEDLDNMTLLNAGKISGFQMEKRYLHYDGTCVWINMSITPINIEDKAHPCHLCIIEDITERKQAEINLKEKNEYIEVQNKKYIQINNELAFQNKEKEKRAAELIIANKELVFQNEEKEKRAAELIIANKELVFQNDEKEKRAVELIKAKEQAEESDRLKSAFLSNMSHEIRTPMNGILGFADLLREPGLSGEEQQEYINIINKSGARMLNIINDIVDISKIESGLMEVDIREVNINEKIETIQIFFKPEVERKGMRIFFQNSLPAKEAIIKTDREKIHAILTKLVKNAIKFSDKGTIEFGYNLKMNGSTGSTDTPIDPTELEFFVKDTGIGIPKDRQEAIFKRFVQADITDKRAFQGAGLGLSITKAYVEMLGGKLWLKSDEGKGSTFYFTIPYNNEPEEKSNTKNIVSAKTENQIKKLKILIVEDDEISEMLITKTVKIFSKEIFKARTGVEAIDACRINPDIDLIMMDIKMPETNGYEATRQIRQFNNKVIIIAQTAFVLKGEKEKAIKAGCNDYISKPIDKALLKELVSKHFTS
jgi:hypothetical protein